MKHSILIEAEVINRRKADIQRGSTENKADTLRRLLFELSKGWTTPEGNFFTLRSYWLKYDRSEYKKVLSCIRAYYKGNTFTDCSPKKSYWYMDEFQKRFIY